MKKNLPFLKTVFLLLFTVFLLQGCREEIENINSPSSNIKIKRISKEQFDENQTLKLSLDKFFSKNSKSSSSASREIYNEYYNFNIITDKISEVDNNGTKSYTFEIKREKNIDGIILENLMMYPEKDGYQFALIQYKFTKDEFNSYLSGEKIDVKNKINIIKLDNSKIAITSARLTPCYQTITEWVPYDPNSPEVWHYFNEQYGVWTEYTKGHYEYITILGLCDDVSSGFTGTNSSTIPTFYTISSGAGYKETATFFDRLFPVPQDNDTSKMRSWVLWSENDDLKNNVLDYTYHYYTVENKTQEVADFCKFLIKFCYQNKESITAEQFQNWFSLNENTNINILDETIAEWNNPNAIKPTVKFMQNERLKCLYNKIKKIDQFNNILQKFDTKFSTKDLIFDYGRVSNPEYIAETTVDGNKVKIKFNENLISTKSNLFLVTTFIHEAIHAEIYRVLIEKIVYTQNNGSTTASYTKDELKSYLIEKKYNKLWDYFSLYGNGVFQHEYMANFKVNTMVNFLTNYDNSLSNDTKNAFSWITLMGTIAWEKLSNDQQKKYIKDYTDYESAGSKTCN